MSDISVFSINAIAIDIASEIYLRKFPAARTNGLLKFTDDDEEDDDFDRGQFGFVSVARIAALIPYIVKTYLDYKTSFIPNLQKHIDLYLNGEYIKILQVVALMYASGRWYKPNTNPMATLNIEYIEQSIAECKKKLQALGIANNEVNIFALLLNSNSYLPPEPYRLYYAILQDAIMIVKTTDKSIDAVEKLKFNKFLNGNPNPELKNKFISILQGVAIAKIRQHGTIAETETAFHPVTLSYKRILGSLFRGFDLTFAALAKKEIPATDTDHLSLSIAELLVKYPSFIEIQTAMDDFVNNVNDIQNSLGEYKNEYASNLWQAWEQTWTRIYNMAIANFTAFKNKAKGICKNQQEYLAAIEQRIQEIENA